MKESNPHRRTCSEAALEYVPLLPLSWRTGLTTGTECTAGNNCPKRKKGIPAICGMKRLLRDISDYSEYMSRQGERAWSSPPKFVVTSTYNLRTVLAFGMRSKQRRGEEYELISNFIRSVHLGHYERISQCPDVLRRWWRHVVELPYNPIQTIVQQGKISVPPPSNGRRHIKYLFVGRLRLWILDRVCSLRNAVASLANRSDTVIVNISESQAFGKLIPEAARYFESSVFCIVTRSDSYSSASFYNAIQAGCIPIVISDWFVFSFYWYIPYSEFTIRVREVDFLRDPHGVLLAIDEMFSPAKIFTMRQKLIRWRNSFTFEYQLIESTTSYGTAKFSSIVPFELLLRELSYVLSPKNNAVYLPCKNPSLCKPSVEAIDVSKQISDKRGHLCRNSRRLIGHYKIVYFMQCSRILWPLRPGRFLETDKAPNGLTAVEVGYVLEFHNVSGRQPEGWSYEPYPPHSDSYMLVKSLR